MRPYRVEAARLMRQETPPLFPGLELREGRQREKFRWLALVMSAILPGAGRDPLFRIEK